MKRNDSRTQTRQDKIEGERPRIREAAEPSLDPLHAAEVAALETGETTFYPQADRHAAALSSPCSDTQRSGMILHLQRTYGNSYVQRLLGSMAVQAKLTVNAPNDIYEQEADRVADTVTRAISSQAQRQEEEEELQMKPASGVQRQEEELQMQPIEEEEELQPRLQRQEEEELLQGKDAGIQSQVLCQDMEARINRARGGGQPLTESVRSSLEPHFERDFGGVRVHTDAEADTSSRQLQAQAFTTGGDIFFRKGAYRPDTDAGRGLLAHELTHVVQQQAAPVIQRKEETPEPEDFASRRARWQAQEKARLKRLLASSPAVPQLRVRALRWIEFGQRRGNTRLVEIGEELLRTGKLRVVSLETNLMAKPAFVGVSLQNLKRGTPVMILELHGSWWRVRTDEGKEGWVHANRVTPHVMRLRSGETGSGSTRGEDEHAGRG